jgi:enamine deaminase RidA (YjgF/YER057c/UK114 family)
VASVPLPANFPALRLDCLSRAALRAVPASWWDSVLGLVPIGLAPDVPATGEVPSIRVGLPLLGSGDLAFEAWRLESPLVSGRLGRVRYRRGGAVLFGCIEIPEVLDGNERGRGVSSLRDATTEAYAEIFRALRELDCPYPLRIWNYLGAITAVDEFGERYRQFNTARRAAFVQGARAVEGDVPAACALGSPAGSPLVVYFLAGAFPPRAIENPRQLSAYHYPRDYGPDSPTFSRAALAPPELGGALFISGTASIVGHLSVHPNDARAQAREAVRNVRTLIDEANRGGATPRFVPENFRYKAYVRHASDLAAIDEELIAGLAPSNPILYLKADICRSELLVEIEAVGDPLPVGVRAR